MSNSKLKRKKILNFINKIKIKFWNLGFAEYTILIGLILIIFTTLIPWFTLPYNWNLVEWIFSKINWIVWCFSIFLVILNIFTLFSIQKKDKIKLFFNIKIKDKIIYTFSSLLFLFMGINSLFTIKGLEILNSEIKIHSWITFYLIAWILFSIWVFFKIRKKEKLTLISINESEDKEENKTKKQNIMKLPFE